MAATASAAVSCPSTTAEVTAPLLLFSLSCVSSVIVHVLALLSCVWLTLYVVPEVYLRYVRAVPDLKRRYDATWALVTGGGTGIGRSLCFKLASQGLNVVVVSLDDAALTATLHELRTAYPHLEFRSVGCTFAPGVDYLEKIKAATDDLTIQLVFNNAGYMVTGFLDQTDPDRMLANLECNATAAVRVTHLFIRKLVARRLTGCVVFTSSPAGYVPAPFASMYAATKAFVSQFAASVHIEVRALGIDVCAVHPSPVDSQFYTNLDHKIELMDAAAKNKVAPDLLPNEMFKTIGVCALRDVGGVAISTRMGISFLPLNMLAVGFGLVAPLLPDYKTHHKNRK